LYAFSCSKYDLSPGQDGRRRGPKFAILCCDAYSRYKKVYFGHSEKEVPRLVRFWLSELGNSVFAGGHFVLGPGCRRHFHTDGGSPMNSEQFARVLEEHGLSANVTSCPHTPSSNGVAERTFGVSTADVRAALAMANLSGEHWSHALKWCINGRDKLATRTITDKITGVEETNTPFFFYYNRMPSLKHAVAFGAECRVLLVGKQCSKGKFDKQTVRGKVVGHAEDGVQIGNTYRYMLGYTVLLNDGRVLNSRNVAIDERPSIVGGGSPYHVAVALNSPTDAAPDADHIEHAAALAFDQAARVAAFDAERDIQEMAAEVSGNDTIFIKGWLAGYDVYDDATAAAADVADSAAAATAAASAAAAAAPDELEASAQDRQGYGRALPRRARRPRAPRPRRAHPRRVRRLSSRA
jgi:hypothetical protein